MQLKLNEYYKEIELLGEADSAISGFELINACNPDIVFLDIEMPKGNAFDLLERFEEINFEIIFTTAYDEYAMRAIKLSAVDYLLKPIDTEELGLAIEKYRKRKNIDISNNSNIKIFAENYNIKSMSEAKAVIPTLHGFEIIKLQDIIYLEADRNYTKIHMVNNTQKLVSRTLKQFEKQFCEFSFIRTHQSFIVNSNCIVKYIKGKTAQIVLSNGAVLNISREKKDEFLTFFQKM